MTTLQAEALHRAESGQSVANYGAIYSGFMAKGISESDIIPRVNVLTFHAWKAKGRSVKKGEHGVKVFTFIECEGSARDPSTGEVQATSYRRPTSTTVFHVSQTETNEARAARLGKDPEDNSARREWNRAKPVSNNHHVRDPGEDAADRWTETH